MRLKIYLIGALAVFTAAQSVGQTANLRDDLVGPSRIAPNDAPRDPKRDYDVNIQKDFVSVFENDFSDDSEWIIESEGEQGEWEIVTTTSPDPADFIGEMASFTADNGFAEFDGIQYLLAGSVDVQNTTIEYNGTFDCSSLDTVIVTFNQRYRAFNYDQTFLEVSTDEGDTWLQYPLNENVVTNEPAIQGELSVDVSAQAAGETGVTLRFRWVSDPLSQNAELTPAQVNAFGSGYGWMIDDILVSSPIPNNLVIGETFYQDYFETFYQVPESDPATYELASEETTEEEIVTSFEYHTQPAYSARPFNFAAAVTNEGTQSQTDVTLVVTFNPPEGDPEEFFSEPITLASGESDTLKIYDIVPASWVDPIAGSYVMDFQVVAAEEDILPGNNFGVSLITRITTDDGEEDGSIIMHANSTTIAGLNTDFNQDIYVGTRYAFSEYEASDRAITHIEFVLDEETEELGIGEQVILNLRNEGVGVTNTGNGLDPEENALFPYDEDEGMVYTITDETPFTTTSTPNWISVELPNPVLISPNEVYQAEILLLPYGSDAVILGFTSQTEPGVTVVYDPELPDDGWGFFGGQHCNLRFRTSLVLDVDDVSYESGIKLTQNYPNPMVDNTRIQFQLDESAPATFQVFDITGRLVYSEDLGNIPALTAHTLEFNREGLSAGTYTYSIVTENERVSRKLTIE